MQARFFRSIESLGPSEFKKEETKEHIRGSAWLLTGRLLAIAINLSTQVLLVRCLSKSGYGAFAYALSIVSLGSSVAGFGLEKSVSRFVAIYQERNEDNKVLGTIVLMVGTILALGLGIILLIFSLKSSLLQSLTKDQEAIALVVVLIALSPLQALESLFTGLLSVFAKARAIFFRKHLVGPVLTFGVVLLLTSLSGNVNHIAVGYLAAGVTGVAISTATLYRVLRQKGTLNRANLKSIKLPAREVFSFTTPLLVSDLAFVLRSQFVVLMLEYFRSTTEVANYRAVLPVARFNMVVYQNFLILFMPLASRMFARQDRNGINNLYQQSAIWIAVMSFPVFAVSSTLSKPLTTLLFGQRYEESAVVLSVLSFGFYFSAVLGFNGPSLRIFGKVRYMFLTDLLVAILSIIVSLILIPRYGALGAAISVSGTLVAQNVLYQIGIMFGTGVGWFSRDHFKVYLIIALAWFGLLLLPPLSISFVVAALVSLLVFRLNRRSLDIERTFPELLRLPLMGRIFGT
ncbi:MAG TPA: flippase [Pyrinomonadaceae bacterium]|nr:flippase [Pyrinomonadaceae bacterium]